MEEVPFDKSEFLAVSRLGSVVMKRFDNLFAVCLMLAPCRNPFRRLPYGLRKDITYLFRRQNCYSGFGSYGDVVGLRLVLFALDGAPDCLCFNPVSHVYTHGHS